jgi:hypothetical protein
MRWKNRFNHNDTTGTTKNEKQDFAFRRARRVAVVN